MLGACNLPLFGTAILIGGDGMDVVIKNGIIITMNKERAILKNFSIGIEDGRIIEIAEKIKGEADFVIDASKKIVMPGLINAHTHLAMTLFRGVADDVELLTWLRREIWPIEANLEAKHVYAGALLGCLEMLSSGVTCFNDMYFFMEETAKSVESIGIRGVLSYPLLDFGDESKGKEMLKEGEKLVKEYQGKELIVPFFGPHAPYTCSEELLIRVKEAADRYNTGVHIHVAETKAEVEESLKERKKTPFEYLESIGFLDKNVVAAHAVHVSKKELEIIKERGVKLVHNPVCNMKLASGVADVPEYISKGICVALGTDGPASNNNLDMFEDMKICALLHKITKMNPSVMPAEEVLEMATINGAKALGLENEIGSIEEGKKADIITIDLSSPNLAPLTNPVSHVVYAARGKDVCDVIVNGNLVMQNRMIRGVDKEDIIKFAEEQAYDLFKKAGREEKLMRW